MPNKRMLLKHPGAVAAAFFKLQSRPEQAGFQPVEGASPAASRDVDASSGGTYLGSVFKGICVAVVISVFFGNRAFGQGCAQCLDTTRATPPAVQAAYRHAILLLGGFAMTFFMAAGALLLRRQTLPSAREGPQAETRPPYEPPDLSAR